MQGMDLTSNNYTDKLDISVSGTTPTGGYLNYENSILKDGCLTMDEYKVTIENGEVTKTEKGSCENQSLTACDSPNFKPSPEEWFAFDASTNTITGFSDAWDGTTDIVIPCQIGGIDVISIKDLYNKNLNSVIINDNMKIIGNSAFPVNKLTKLIIGNGIEEIGDAAFNGNNLKQVIIPNNVKKIGAGSFSSGTIEILILGNNVEIIDSGAFSPNKITELIIPNSVIEIGGGAFTGNQIEYLMLGNSLEKIGPAAFYGNNLKNITIPQTVSTIGASAFQKYEQYSNTNLTTIYNNTGKSFDWYSIINDTTGDEFKSGFVENEYGNVEIKG